MNEEPLEQRRFGDKRKPIDDPLDFQDELEAFRVRERDRHKMCKVLEEIISKIDSFDAAVVKTSICSPRVRVELAKARVAVLESVAAIHEEANLKWDSELRVLTDGR